MAQRAGLHDRAWEETQIKVFSRWIAKHLKSRGIDFADVTKEFSDGVKLINLMEVLTKESIGQNFNKNPKIRVQKLENCSIALDYITKKKGIKLVGIGSNDIVDNNLMLTLGLTWSIISKYQIEDISVEEATARDALLIWCKKNTQGYDGVNVTNFTNSWSTGLAFCALINKFRPQILDYSTLNHANALENCQKAFEACKKLGIYVFLDPEDAATESPDEKSIVTQVAEFFHFFASESKVGVMADKIKGTVKIQTELEALKSNYAEQAQAAMNEMNSSKTSLSSKDYEKTVPGLKAKLSEVISYGRNSRPKIVELRSKALATWASLITKCKSTSRPVPAAPAGLEPESLNNTFSDIDKLSNTRRKELQGELHESQQGEVAKFDEECQKILTEVNAINDKCSTTSEAEALNGLLGQAQALKGSVSAISESYKKLGELKLNARAKQTDVSVMNEIEQCIARIQVHIDECQRNGRVEAFEAKADVFAAKGAQLESSINSVEGELEARRSKLFELDNESKSQLEAIQTLAPLYADLEKDELHLEIEHTPTSLSAFFTNISAHINTLIREIDSAIAAQKGLQISEEQLAEFRDTFSHFDKSNTKHLQYYELKACLTALGDTSTDEECKAMIAKYCSGATSLDFDGYVKIMLDRFSKAETAATTLDAFRAIAQNSNVVTDAQLSQYFSPEEAQFLKTHMPAVEGGYDASAWVNSLYAK